MPPRIRPKAWREISKSCWLDATRPMDVVAQAPVLSGQQLSLRRGTTWLFKALNFSLHAGEILCLRGANGCGKTSLLRTAVGLVRPDAGSVAWRGLPLLNAVGFAPELVYIGHAHALKDDLSVTESLGFLAALHGRPSTAPSIAAALKQLSVYSRRNQSVRVLSQGQRKRVALARLALESEPGLWVLDEPYDALDAEGMDVVDALVLNNSARGGCTLMTSHIPRDLGATPVRTLNLGSSS